MKIKHLLILGFTFLNSYLTFSQTDNLSKIPKGKNFMIEINFNPFGDDDVFSFKNLQTKYWINNKTALRFGIQFNSSNNSRTKDNYESNNDYGSTLSEKSLLVGFKPGIEFRFLPHSKISPYWGFEVSYENKSSSSQYIDYLGKYDYINHDLIYYKIETKIEDAWRETEIAFYNINGQYYTKTSYDKERGYSSYGLNLLFGTDVFILENLYMGFEIGIAYKILKYRKIKVEINNSEVTDPLAIENNIPSSKTSNFGFYYNNFIRLGVYF